MKIQSVTFYPQSYDQCGPSSLATLLEFWGNPEKPADIASEIFLPELSGTLMMDMEVYAKNKGMYTDVYNGSIGDLIKKVDEGYPLIIFVDNGFFNFKMGHYAVVVGYNKQDQYVLLNWGVEKEKVMSFDNLQSVWKRTAYTTLLVSSKQNY